MDTQNPFGSNPSDIITITPIDPSAGNNLSLAVASNARWRILFVGFLLTTDANVATRLVQVHGFDSLDRIYDTAPNLAQAASLAHNYSFNTGVGQAYTGGDGSVAIAPINSDHILRSTDDIRITIQSIQAGDTITDIRIRFLQWITEN